MENYNDLSQNREIAPAKGGFPAMLEQMRPQIASALPRHLSADRMLRIALTEFRKNPAIGKCEPRSVLGSIVVLAQLGLEPGVMGQSFLIPYKGTCTAVPGWQGYVDLVARSGRASVWTGAVYAGDEFDYAYGDRPFITHRPSDNSDRDTLQYVYAIGRVKDSEWPIIEVWSKTKAEKHRDRYNRVGNKHYSYKNFEMYARKVALLQVIKYMPKSVELQQAMDLENTAETGQGINVEDAIEGTWSAPEFVEPDPEPPTTTEAKPEEANKKKTSKKTNKKKTSKKTASKPAKEPEEATEDNDNPGMTYNQIFMALNTAETVDTIDELLDAANGLEDQKKRESITTILKQRREDLSEGGEEGREPGEDDDLGLE